MTTMIREVYDALKEAGVSEQKAQAAATTLAEPTERFREIDRRFDLIDARFDALDAKIDHVKSDLEAKIERTRTDLEAKIERTRTDLEAKIDRTRTDLEAKIDALDSKIEHVGDKIVIRLGSLLVVGLGVLAILMKIL